MEKVKRRMLLAAFAAYTFIIPFIQLGIGFRYIVKDGQDPNKSCAAAPDLPLLMAIGGIFTIIFLGITYGFLLILSKVERRDSDVSGNGPKVIIGLIGFIFGSLTFIFFILFQMRVYGPYSSGVQYSNGLLPDFCQSAVMRGGLAVIILTYFSIIILIIIYVIVLKNTRKQIIRQRGDIELMEYPMNERL